jgi:hypothetical protein
MSELPVIYVDMLELTRIPSEALLVLLVLTGENTYSNY